MKKIFFNISTRGGDLQTPTKTKRKFLRTFSFTSLALLMGAAGVFAFAPLGANSNNLASANTLSDEINTKADGENIKYAPSPLGLDPENDPVIYTTESGLEIKYGGAITALGGGNEKNDFAAETLPSGKPLSGYPYFTMGTYNGYAVNWVIIGKSTTGIPTTSTSTGMSDYNYEKLSTWQGKTSESPTYKHFFEQTYEATTPAGAAIKNSGTLNNYAARKIEYMFNPSILSSIVSNSEIDAGCVLVLSENCLGTSYFNQDIASNNCYEGSAIQTICLNFYNTTLGLTSSQKNLIVKQDFTSLWRDVSNSTNQTIFLLGGRGEKFSVEKYLTAAQRKLTTAWHTRSGHYDYGNGCYYVDTSGNFITGSGIFVSNVYGVRPACVVKFV